MANFVRIGDSVIDLNAVTSVQRRADRGDARFVKLTITVDGQILKLRVDVQAATALWNRIDDKFKPVEIPLAKLPEEDDSADDGFERGD